MHDDGLADDEAIGDELANGLSRVRVADLADLVRIQPDLVLATADHVGRQPLLRREVDPVYLVASMSAKGLSSVRIGSVRIR